MTTGSQTTTQHVHRFADIVARHRGEERWAERLLVDGRNRIILISAPPGTPPDPHLHPDFHEWWVLLGGEIQWQTGEWAPFTAKLGDIVIAPCGQRHDIQPKGTVQTFRLAVSAYNSNHDLKGVPPSRLLPVPADWTPPNMIHTSLDFMFKRHGAARGWAEEVVLDTRNRANMICQLPGETNRAHWHPDFDEWWVVLKGELEWKIGDAEPVRVKQKDIVFAPAGQKHGIRTVGNESSVRLAVTIPGPRHVFTDTDGHSAGR